MILVQNLLQQLSGNNLFNKIGAVILCIAILSISCVPKKTITSSQKPSPRSETQTSATKQNSKVKEVEWKIADPKKNPPIGAPEIIESEKQKSYNVVYLIPFGAKTATVTDFGSKESQSYKFINYYAGVKYAAEDSKIDAQTKTSVFDTESQSINSILNMSELKNADVIIGPYDSEQLKEVANFARNQKITHISPWKSSKSIAEKNPYHVQTRPSLTSHYDFMVEKAIKDNPGAPIFVLGKNDESDKKRMQYLVDVGKAFGRSDIKSFSITEQTLLTGDMVYNNMFSGLPKAVVLIPNWSSSDEDFIYGCVRRLRVEKAETEMIVYGMPKMMDTDKIPNDYYENLNVHIVRSEFVDKQNSEVKNLRSRFFREFNTFPAIDLYEGYDMMNFVLNNLTSAGKNFQMKMSRDNSNYIQTNYQINPIFINKEAGFKPENIDYFENTALTVVKFHNGRFQK